MIDYEKLKEVDAYARKLNHKYRDIRIDYHFRLGCSGASYDYCNMTNDDFEGNTDTFEFDSVDDLITKLEELTDSESKYKKAWYLGQDNSPRWTYVHNKPCYQFCDVSDIEALGRTMYDSEAYLIQAQIAYWLSLRKPTPLCAPSTEECKHESDGAATALLCNPPIYQYKCKKCGEFYR